MTRIWTGSPPHLNGARFSMPSSEIDDTNATGLGTMPLVRIEHNLLAYAVSAKKVAKGHTQPETLKPTLSLLPSLHLSCSNQQNRRSASILDLREWYSSSSRRTRQDWEAQKAWAGRRRRRGVGQTSSAKLRYCFK